MNVQVPLQCKRFEIAQMVQQKPESNDKVGTLSRKAISDCLISFSFVEKKVCQTSRECLPFNRKFFSCGAQTAKSSCKVCIEVDGCNSNCCSLQFFNISRSRPGYAPN